ncbi:hypothetical protein V1264_003224 [Littorina saxatilis]|uniref:Uncharacterized protein n=1 Tax=Littorina saxatilis TaxID=31220 RepID=A0AAN9B4H5_9CAEN
MVPYIFFFFFFVHGLKLPRSLTFLLEWVYTCMTVLTPPFRQPYADFRGGTLYNLILCRFLLLLFSACRDKKPFNSLTRRNVNESGDDNLMKSLHNHDHHHRSVHTFTWCVKPVFNWAKSTSRSVLRKAGRTTL